MRAERVADDAALAALAPEWEALWRRAPGASPFQSPRWLLAWWRQFGTGEPRVGVLRDDQGGLAGVLPLYRLPAGRKLLPLGAGLTDRHDALLAPGLPDDAAAALLAASLRGETWPCDLFDLAPGSALARAAPAGWRGAARAGEACPVLALRPTLAATLPARQARKLRMARHRCDRQGAWRIEAATPQTLPAALECLFALHGARWRERGEAGVLEDGAVRAFHRDAAPALLAAGLLRLWRLYLGADAVGAVLALADAGGRLLFYLGGFDTGAAYCSPGAVLIGAMLEQAIAEGRTEADFLRGGEAYKYAWGAVDRPNLHLRLQRA